MTRTVARSSIALLVSVALMFCIALVCNVATAQAKDIPGYFNKSKLMKVGKTYTQKFEKKGDSDAFKFNLKPGKKYAVVVYDLSGRSDEERGYDGISAEYMYLNKSNSFGISAIHGRSALGDEAFMFKIGKGKRGTYTGVAITGDYKGKYKFRVYQLTSKKHKIKYVVGDGQNSSDNPTKFTNKMSFIELEDAYSGMQTFDGWWTKASGGKRVKAIDTSVNKNVTVYAHWTTD